jgi:hypothetical protein
MFDHLVGFTPDVEDLENLDAEVEPVKRVSSRQLLHAQQATSNWLQELGAPGDEVVVDEAQKTAAREAFAALATSGDEEKNKAALLKLKAPAAMSHLNAMLEAHDWEFVARAKELRAFAVTKIIKETDHHDARIRLRALELLGKVTEVGLFTERVEIKQVEVGDSELEARIKEKLERFMVTNGQLQDVEIKQLGQEEATTDFEEQTDEFQPTGNSTAGPDGQGSA